MNAYKSSGRSAKRPLKPLCSIINHPCAIMTLSFTVFLFLIGLAASCVSLPQVQYVNNKPYHLMQYMECKGGKIYEISNIRDIDECKAACLQRECRAVNLYQLSEFEFKCEILAYVRSYQPAQGAACYVSYY